MTLPDTSFVCKNIDVEAAARANHKFRNYPESWDSMPAWFKREEIEAAEATVAAALGEVIPAEVEKRGHLQPHPTKEMIEEFRYTERRYTTKWQPVVSDKE
jgi:hypothetical protein